MVRTFLATAGALAAVALAAPAAAAPATITVTGNVLNGYDPSGVFGAAGANLAGLPFSAIFTIAPQPGNTMIDTASLSYLFGMGAASPVTAALTIGAGTHNFGGKLSGSARAVNNAGAGGTDGLYYSSEDTDVALLPSDSTLFYVSVDSLRDLLTRADYTSYGTIDLTAADNAQGQARIANRDPATGAPGASTYANLSLTSITARVGAPVPEPATWAMMVTGFAVAGVALRRRRVSARVRFA